MWQTIEVKAAAIEQFRKGDLLQRVIDDVQSEAANAADMKAAASGNPLILMQVKLASDLRKLEALHSQHQRGQHRLRDSLRWLDGTGKRLADAEAVYSENIRRRDAHTRIIKEKDKEKIRVELAVGDKVLGDKDNERMKELLRDGVTEVTRKFSSRALFGTYRGFNMYIMRHTSFGGSDGFRFAVKGVSDKEFQPDNLTYSFDDKISLTGLFQRMDNFLAKGLNEGVEASRETARREAAELETVKTALGKEFPQKDELDLVRENHGAIIRELQRMQEDPKYVSTWEPKTALAAESPPMPMTQEQVHGDVPLASVVAEGKRLREVAEAEPVVHTLKFGSGNGRTEYTVTNQRNGHQIQDGHVLHRTYYSGLVGSLGQSFYDDGRWHTTATAPKGVKLQHFGTPEAAMEVARNDAVQRGLEGAESQPVKIVTIETPTSRETYHSQLAGAGFYPTDADFYGKDEYKQRITANDGGIYDLRVFQAAKDKVGLRVQYEKDHIIDGARTVHAQFDTLGEALEYVGGYKNFAQRQDNAETLPVAPAWREPEQELPRIRMR